MISPSTTATATDGRRGAGYARVHGARAGHGQIEKMDSRSDIYALGWILYHILALRSAVGSGLRAEQCIAQHSYGLMSESLRILDSHAERNS